MYHYLFILFVWVLLTIPNITLAFPTSETVATDITQTQLISDTSSITADKPFWVGLNMKLSGNWHSYWENPGDSGMPIRLSWQLPEGFTAGPIHWPVPERVEIAGLMSYAYHHSATFLVPIIPPKTLSNETYTFSLEAEWLVCEEICIPESGHYTLSLPSNTATSQTKNAPSPLAAAIQNLSKPFNGTVQYQYHSDALNITLHSESWKGQTNAPAEFFPITANVIDNIAPITHQWQENKLTFTIKPIAHPPSSEPLKFLFTAGDHAFIATTPTLVTSEITPETKNALAPQTSDLSFSLALLFAFLGGLILNIMPCVLPILSLKLLALVNKAGNEQASAIRHGMAYTLGILLSFALMAGLLIALQQAGETIGWGFQLQSPAFITTLMLLMYLVGLNLSGFFEIPQLFGNVGQSLTTKTNSTGTFFTGVLAVLVATPCTAPFMAPAIGFALTLPPLSAMAIFLSLGLGFAAPLLLISLFPSLLKLMPKPGTWMVSFKQFLAFPMYATAAWLLWVLVQQAGTDALALALAMLIGITFLIWLRQKVSYTLDQFIGYGILALVAIGMYMIFTTDMSLKQNQEFYSDQRLEELRSQGKPVFVNMTADWCLTCKFNERSSLSTDTVQNHFEEHGIVYLKGDWTNRNAEIKEYLRSFNRQGVPLYVFYPKDGSAPHILPQLLTPGIVVEETSR